MKRVYMDNGATTRVTEPVFEAMQPYFCEIFGNPSSVHAFGRETRKVVEHARQQVATALNAEPNEIYFTGCGTESDNWAVRGAAYQNIKKGKHIITTTIEHHAILHTCEQLEKEGFEVTYLPVDEYGLVTAEQLDKAIRPDTTIVSIMAANNEIGTLEPIAELAEVCKKHGVLFHTDAVQAIGSVKIDVKAMNIDMLSMSGHKFHAPKGVGALYARKGIALTSLIEGGAQERGKRAGTENVAGIAAMAAALKESCEHMEENNARIVPMRDRLIRELGRIPHSIINGSLEHHVPGTVNLCFEGIEGESLLLMLDREGICASSGSACTSGSLDPSHVLLSLGLPYEVAHGSLRLSIGEYNREEDIDRILEVLPRIVEYLRGMSPLWEELEKGERAHLI